MRGLGNALHELSDLQQKVMRLGASNLVCIVFMGGVERRVDVSRGVYDLTRNQSIKKEPKALVKVGNLNNELFNQ